MFLAPPSMRIGQRQAAFEVFFTYRRELAKGAAFQAVRSPTIAAGGEGAFLDLLSLCALPKRFVITA